ncbi:hypothetical protein F9K33_02860 [bacterium]|nr:MAG: hypothetical protein F9K33_02860 [bacterium]
MSLDIILNTIFSGVSALSSVIQTWSEARNRNETLGPNEVRNNFIKIKTESIQSHYQFNLVINSKILDVIRGNVEKATEDLIKSLSDPNNDDTSKDKAVERAKYTICNELKRLKDLNNDELPDQFDDVWKSNRCL